MAFVIPDNILETLVCDTCNKFLSVKPIIVYANRRIKCGRCSRSKKQCDGVISLYGVIAEKCIFKCINRFDGCRKLLTYSEVRDHEKVCSGRFYQCPICTDSMELPSFLLVKHFREYHKEALLDYPGLLFDPDYSSETSFIYLYRKEDDLFFLKLCSSKLENSLQMIIFYIGDEKLAKTVTQQFFVTSESRGIKFSSKVMSCAAYGKDSGDFFHIQDLNTIQTIFVKFNLEFTDLKLTMLPLQVDSNVPMVTQFFEEHDTFSPMVTAKNVRKVHLSSTFQQKFPKISLNKSCTGIIESDTVYFLHCFNCQEICWRGLSRDSLVQRFFYSTKFTHSLCYYCFQMLKHEKKILENDYQVSNFPNDMLKNIEFLCLWNCGETFPAEYNLGHEQSCKLQLLQSCPEVNCNFKGTIVDISVHMTDMHPGREICSYSNLYISCLFDRNVYVFVQNQFVHLQILSNQGLSIRISLCGPVCESKEQNIPLVLLFDDNKNYLMNFQNSITKNEGNHWLKIFIKKDS